MNEAAELLLGTHDFSAFRSSGSVDTSPIKTIYAAKWQQQGEEILFRISGDGFLYHMVRNRWEWASARCRILPPS